MKLASSALEERCDTAASRYYRRLTPYCEAFGKSAHTCWGPLDWAHIVTRGNQRLRYEEKNHLIICRSAHQFYTAHPLEWKRFVRHYFPDRWYFVETHKNEYQVTPHDYEALIKKFRD